MYFQYLPPLYLIYAYLSVIPQASSQTTQGTVLTDDVGSFINQVLADWKSPGGASVAVVRRDDKGVWNVETKGYGIATGNGSKVTEHTLFSIGSNSKLFDVFATGLLIHNETLSPRLSWTTKIASVIPIWGLEDPIADKQAAIIDLMSHRTGLPRHDFSYKNSDDISTLIKKVSNQRPSVEFREVYQYCNSMYAILSYLPTQLLPSKIPFARYVKQNILDPLEMTSTTYSYDVADASGQLADGMVRQRTNTSGGIFDGIARPIPFWYKSGGEDGNALSGPGGLISNAVDMATWLQTLILKGVKPGTNVSVIPADVVDKAATGVSVESSPVTQFPEFSPVVYGGGQQLGTYRGHEYIDHDGSVPGFNSYINRFPFDSLGVAVLTNDKEYGTYISRIIESYIADTALGLETVDWNSRLKALVSIPQPESTPRPSNPSSPSVNFTALAGTYNNPGYGKFELCLVAPSNPAASQTCKIFAANVSTILPGVVVDPKVPTFLTVWDNPFLSYIRLTHFNGDVFNISGLASYPTNDPSEPYFTYDLTGPYSGITAQVAVEGGHIGIGMTGIWGAGDGVPSPEGKTVRERSEVFFDKA